MAVTPTLAIRGRRVSLILTVDKLVHGFLSGAVADDKFIRILRSLKEIINNGPRGISMLEHPFHDAYLLLDEWMMEFGVPHR